MINNKSQIKPGDKLLVSSHHGLGLKIQKFQIKRDPASGIYNHSADFWSINGELCLQEQTQAPYQKIKANENLTLFEDYLRGDSDLLILKFRYDVEELGLFREWQKILIEENGKLYDFHNLLKFSIVRTIIGWWSDPRKKNLDRRTVCHESAMLKARKFGKLLGLDWFPEYYKANVSDLYYSDLYDHERIDKVAFLKSLEI